MTKASPHVNCVVNASTDDEICAATFKIIPAPEGLEFEEAVGVGRGAVYIRFSRFATDDELFLIAGQITATRVNKSNAPF